MQESEEREGWWLDSSDALERIERAPVASEVKAIARSICTDGVALVREARSVQLCHEVMGDYLRYTAENASYVRENLDSLGREKRLVNFHLWSDAAARIGAAPRLMQALDFLFGQEAAIYSSLTFKFGTQQPVHRDTLHFATWPRRMFVGVWTALEDIDPGAGPLFYHPGAHRFALAPAEFMRQAEARLPDAPIAERLLMALDLYNGEVIRTAPSIAPAKLLDMKAGDVAIWHPELPHGGSAALDPKRTRWSIVFHCSPKAVQVHQHDRFFSHSSSSAPPDRYGYFVKSGRSFAMSGDVAYM